MAETRDRREDPPRRGSPFMAWFLALLASTGCGALGWYYYQLWTEQKTMTNALTEATASAQGCIGELEPLRTSASACESARAEEQARVEKLAVSHEEIESNLEATASELESLRKL